MFKNMIVYRIAPQWQVELTLVEEALAKAPFVECGATQEKSLGWVPPRGEQHGPLAESVGGHWILRFMVESKVLPASVLARRVKEKAERIEKETGRKPGKKESKELKDEAKLDLLPMAYTKQGSMWVWIDTASRLLVLDTGSQGRADEVVTLLVESLPGLSVSLLNTQTSPQAAMSHWLKEQDPPVGFTVDRECELKSSSEEKSLVKYGRHPLDIDEVKAHIDAGKLPTKLAMTWDDRVSFMLTEGLQIKKVSFLDTVFEGTKSDDSGFDTDVAIATGELVNLIPDLIDALGGESDGGLGQPEAPSGAPEDQVVSAEGDASDAGGASDAMYEEALSLVRSSGRASISFLQRRLRIGYGRAALLLEAMESSGGVSKMDASGGRSVIAHA